jgi:proteic killer suppression protein
MIQSFRHKGLEELFSTGHTVKIGASMVKRCLLRLDAIDQAMLPQDLHIPGFNFHPLKGQPTRYSVHANGPWCITFEWNNNDALLLDFENYH